MFINNKLPPTLTLLQAVKECQLNQIYTKCLTIYCNVFQKFINDRYRLEYTMRQQHLSNKETVINYFNDDLSAMLNTQFEQNNYEGLGTILIYSIKTFF